LAVLQKNQNLLQARKINGREDFYGLEKPVFFLEDTSYLTNQQPFRENASDPGGNNPVTHLNIFLP
jgi:hypothetical protein